MSFLIGLVIGMTLGVLVMGMLRSGEMVDAMRLIRSLRGELERLAGIKEERC